MNDFIKILSNKINISFDKIKKLSDFNDILYKKNEVLNLTQIKKEDSVYRNFLDSLNHIALNELKTAKKVIDIGSGSGFPAIALAIVLDNVEFTMIDATNKKVKFLEDAIEKLNIKNAQVLCARAEKLAHNKNYRQKYDIAVARAVARLSVLTELACGFVKIDGKLLLYKGKNATVEINDAKPLFKTLKLNKCKLQNYTIFDEKDSMCMIMINKYDNLSSNYPRNYSKIIKSLKN